MKYIDKHDEPEALIHFKNRQTANWKPSFDNLDRPIKDKIREALLNEQGFLCCYCEGKVNADNSHIEHFVPQSRGIDPLNYGNLLISCQKNTTGVQPRHCGKRKDNDRGCDYHPDLLISPTDPACEDFFGYKGDGRIFPVNTLNELNQKKADYTINTLGLNIKKLIRERLTAINTILDEINGLDPSRRDKIIQRLLSEARGQEDRGFHPYFTTIRYVFSSPGN